MNVLFVNSVEPACGVHQFGLSLWRVLRQSQGMIFSYAAPCSDAELLAAIQASKADFVLWNFYPCTMPWVTLQTLNAVRALRLTQATIYHETRVTGFDAFLYPDPTFKGDYRQLNQWFGFGRPLPAPRAERTCVVPEVPIISTSGFGFTWKGHERLVRMVVNQFHRARLRLHLPFARYGDADGAQALATADRCRQLVRRTPGIQLEIDHDFMEPDRFVDWLAESDLNAYLYDESDPSRGIASTTDHALAARRPIAVTRTRMFRHLHQCEGIFVEDSTLSEIMARGIEPLREVYQEFSDGMIIGSIEHIIRAIPDAHYCRLLNNADRHRLEPVVDEMKAAVPEMMSRKIPEANVQQAWTLEMVRKTGARSVLCVGCFEDTGFETLRATKTHVLGIDPDSKRPWEAYTLAKVRERHVGAFDCIFSTSVIEHVADDEQFVRDLCDCLASDGVCILTADFREGWRAGDPLPATDCRLYTAADIERLGRVLESKGCYWVNSPDLEGAPDFHYQGHDYSFVGLVFKKL